MTPVYNIFFNSILNNGRNVLESRLKYDGDGYHIDFEDEIHCDLIKPGTEYTPFASVSENCRENSITCVAPTKAFNLAGIQTAAVIVPDKNLRNKVNRG